MTTTVNALTSTILNGKQLKEQMIHLIERGIVPYVKGQPGV